MSIAWSLVSKAAERSGKVRTENCSFSEAIRSRLPHEVRRFSFCVLHGGPTEINFQALLMSEKFVNGRYFK